MSLLSWFPLVAVVVWAAVKTIFEFLRAERTRKLMPPGPPGMPFFGNAFQIPEKETWRRFMEWKNLYGPVFSLNLAGNPMIVVNTFKVAGDLLDRRSAIYSDRPRMIVSSDLICGGKSMAFMPYGDLWRKSRRAAHEAFNILEVEAYKTVQEREAARLVLSLLSNEDNWEHTFERSTASTIVSIVYGTALADKSMDIIVDKVRHLIATASRAGGAGAHLVEIFPSMLHLPDCLAKWKREGKAAFDEYSTLFQGFQDDVRRDLTENGESPSFCQHMIDTHHKHGLTSLEAAWLAGIMVGAGTDTTAAMLSVFIFAMILYPDVMRRAQAEIDTVIGQSRVPDFQDQSRLPYVDAIVREMLRWRPVTPLGIPRRSMQDDWYEGHFIPKGTTVVENIWAMGHDPEYFSDPEEFRPERFLGTDEKIAEFIPETNVQKHFTFGFGRRICPGKNLAFRTLWMDIACMLWALDISPAIDEQGNPIIPSKDACIDDCLVVRPVPFKCSTRSRFPSAKDSLELRAAR